MTIFSNNKSAATTKAGFKKYHVNEVATSQTDAKQIADSYKKNDQTMTNCRDTTSYKYETGL